jgi:hypothetical protein
LKKYILGIIFLILITGIIYSQEINFRQNLNKITNENDIKDNNCFIQVTQEYLNNNPDGLLINLSQGECIELIENVCYQNTIILENETIFFGNNYTINSISNKTAINLLDNSTIYNITVKDANVGVVLKHDSKAYNINSNNNNFGFILLNNSKIYNSLANQNTNTGFILFDNTEIIDSNSYYNNYGILLNNNSFANKINIKNNHTGAILSNTSKIKNSISKNNNVTGYILKDNSSGYNLISKNNKNGFSLMNKSKINFSKSENNSEIGFQIYDESIIKNSNAKENGLIGVLSVGNWMEDKKPVIDGGAFCNNNLFEMYLTNSKLRGVIYTDLKKINGNYISDAIFMNCEKLEDYDTIYN